jgi:hypothetical protein
MAFLWAPVAAQGPTQPVAGQAGEQMPRVSLGFASAPPGRQVTIPVTLEGGAGHRVRRVVSEIAFPAAHLEFVRLERAALLDEAAFDASAQVRSRAAVENSPLRLVEVRIQARNEGTSLRDGILAYLVFRILPSTTAEKTPEIVLAHDVRIFEGLTDPETPIAERSEEAKLIVENPNLPVFACFFYMH